MQSWKSGSCLWKSFGVKLAKKCRNPEVRAAFGRPVPKKNKTLSNQTRVVPSRVNAAWRCKRWRPSPTWTTRRSPSCLHGFCVDKSVCGFFLFCFLIKSVPQLTNRCTFPTTVFQLESAREPIASFSKTCKVPLNSRLKTFDQMFYRHYQRINRQALD